MTLDELAKRMRADLNTVERSQELANRTDICPACDTAYDTNPYRPRCDSHECERQPIAAGFANRLTEREVFDAFYCNLKQITEALEEWLAKHPQH